MNQMHDKPDLYTKKFQDCTEEELRMILEWRNHEQIRLKMVDQSFITLNNHLSFVQNLRNNRLKDYRLVYDEKKTIGTVNLIQVSEERAELGLYKNPYNHEKGTGTLLMNEILKLAAQKSIRILELKVLKDNEPAFKLYRKFEFKIIQEDGQFYYMSREI